MSGWFPVFLNQFLLSSFLFVLLLFWLVIFDAFRKKTPLARSYRRFYAPKAALMLLFWILAIAIYTWTQYVTCDTCRHLSFTNPHRADCTRATIRAVR